jgi:hypothetical protein
MHVARQTYAARFSTGYESTNVRAMPDHRHLPFLRRQAEGGGKKVAGRNFLQVFSGRDAVKSDCLSTHACHAAIFDALPRARRRLALGRYWPTAPKSERRKRTNSEQQTIKRLGITGGCHRLRTVEDVTGALLFLTSDDAALITGQAIVVDGAQYQVG